MNSHLGRRHWSWRVRLGFLLLIAILASAGLTDAVQAADAQWSASYWNNKSLSGAPVLQRLENEVNYDWGGGGPHLSIDSDQFSARWTRSVNFAAGSYRFTATMDDGMRVWVDNVLIIDSWWDSQVHSMAGDVYLNAGDHSLKVEYFEAGGMAVAKLSWTAIGGTAPVPIGHWKGEYFNNKALTGTPVLTRDDVNIDFDWGVGSPQGGVVASDSFSVRWTRNLSLDAARYRFVATADDGVRLWVNNKLIIDQWHDAGPTVYAAEIDVPGGSIPVKMEFYDNTGGAVARLGWLKVSSGNWRGEYFNNRTLSGTPVLVRDDNQVDFNWGTGSPAVGINTDDFSVRWTRTVNLTGGRYRFTIVSDDGARVLVDGRLVTDAWSDHQALTFNGETDLAAGDHTVVVEYYDHGGGAQVHFSYTVITSPTPPTQPAGNTGTIAVYRLNVRTGPGLSYTILGQLSRGDVVTFAGYRSQDNNWVMINWAGGTAWISSLPVYLQTSVTLSSLPVWQGAPQPQPVAPATGLTATVGRGAYLLNMREGPGTEYAILRAVRAGTVVELLGRNSAASWAKVRLSDGAIGWMSTRYLSSSVAFSSLPLTN